MILYPRISNLLAREVLRELTERGERSATDFVVWDHPKAVAAATGGLRVKGEHIARLRDRVMDDLSVVWEEESYAEYDRRLGRSLHANLGISLSDAAHSETWNFLTLMVFPDVLVHRFPQLHEARALGGHRNVLRRVWLREELIEGIGDVGMNPLNEDEYVQLLERTSVARTPGLLKVLVSRLVHMDLANRAQFTRDVMKRVTRLTGTFELSVLSSEDLFGLVDEAIHSELVARNSSR